MTSYLLDLARKTWREDRKDGKDDNNYRRRSRMSSGSIEVARFDDYFYGFRLGADKECSRTLEYLVVAYKKEHHGEIVDLAAFQLGYQRGYSYRG